MKRMNWLAAATGSMIACSLPAALAQPQIEVRIDDTILANNHEHVFPLTAIGDSVPLIVVVRNIGDEDLVFTTDPPIEMGGGFPEQFSLIQAPLEAGNKLSPNGSTAFRVDFQPTIEFYRLSTRIFLWTNDPDTLFAITVAGESFDPNAPVEPEPDADDEGDGEQPQDAPDPDQADTPGDDGEINDDANDAGMNEQPEQPGANPDGAAGDPDYTDETEYLDDSATAKDSGGAAPDAGEQVEEFVAQEGLCGFGVPFALFSGLLGLTASRRAIRPA